MAAYLFFIAGLACAAGGGELFVRGAIGLGNFARVAPALIAATIGAFATSSPELVVAVIAALEGVPQISLGNALGGNIVNFGLILAVALLFAPISIMRAQMRRDYAFALLAPLLLGALLVDGQLSRLDCALLLACFALWLGLSIGEARRQRSARSAEDASAPPLLKPALETGAGIVLLLLAGHLIVDSAQTIARAYNVSEFIIGVTLIAIGTSTPELATLLVSRLRGRHDIGLGAILGSCSVNGLLIIGVAGAITPYETDFRTVLPALLVGMAMLFLAWPGRANVLGRGRGLALMLAYLIHLALSATR